MAHFRSDWITPIHNHSNSKWYVLLHIFINFFFNEKQNQNYHFNAVSHIAGGPACIYLKDLKEDHTYVERIQAGLMPENIIPTIRGTLYTFEYRFFGDNIFTECANEPASFWKRTNFPKRFAEIFP